MRVDVDVLCLGCGGSTLRALVPIRFFESALQLTWSSVSHGEFLEQFGRELQRLRTAIDNAYDVLKVKVTSHLRRIRRVTLVALVSAAEDGDTSTSAAGATTSGAGGAGSGGGAAGGSAVRAAPRGPGKGVGARSGHAAGAAAGGAPPAERQVGATFDNTTVLEEDDVRYKDDASGASGNFKVSHIVRKASLDIAHRGEEIANANAGMEIAVKEMVDIALTAYEQDSPGRVEALEAAQAYVTLACVCLIAVVARMVLLRVAFLGHSVALLCV